MSLVPVVYCVATLSAAAAHPLAKLEGQFPLNLNIRSLWFEALGCSAPNVDLKGKHDSSVAATHHKITPHEKLVSAVLTQIYMHSNRLLHWSKIPPRPLSPPTSSTEERTEMMGKGKKREEKERVEREDRKVMEMEEREGGVREGERKVKNLHITMPEKNQNIFHRKMGHFQILVPYQTN